MLDHNGWTKYLPRNGTPSDIDTIKITVEGEVLTADNVSVYDDAGVILYFEFSTKEIAWQGLKRGQHLLYQHLVSAARGNAVAVLGYHNTPMNEQIDTLTNVTCFHIMSWVEGKGIVYPSVPIRSNELWIKFVRNYANMVKGYK